LVLLRSRLERKGELLAIQYYISTPEEHGDEGRCHDGAVTAKPCKDNRINFCETFGFRGTMSIEERTNDVTFINFATNEHEMN
jgi:hypothetical protein